MGVVRRERAVHHVAAVTRLRARDGMITEADLLLNAVEYDVEGLCALYPPASPPPASVRSWWWLAIVGALIVLWRGRRRRQKQARVIAPPR